ncbi:MAG: delta-60 repeat domain-containing protein [Bdellovibrionales bacterium]|nr:delta-60 repeat domain-containing protein [Bdellovibrionales bacterium]
MYSPIWGFDGSQIYKFAYELDSSGNTTGKYLIAGDFTTYRGQDVPDGFIRLNADGTWDSSFNVGGSGGTVYTFQQELNASGGATGKIFLGIANTTLWNGGSVPKGLIRIDSTGQYDTSFNNGGVGIDGFSYIIDILLQRDTAGKLHRQSLRYRELLEV